MNELLKLLGEIDTLVRSEYADGNMFYDTYIEITEKLNLSKYEMKKHLNKEGRVVAVISGADNDNFKKSVIRELSKHPPLPIVSNLPPLEILIPSKVIMPITRAERRKNKSKKK